MTERRVPNLEEMGGEEAHRFMAGLLSRLDPEEEYDARHPKDYVLEWPQSGERFRGRESLRAMQRTYPITAPPSVRLRRVLVRDGLWVAEGVGAYGGERAFEVAMILHLRDGRMWRDRWYFAGPFEAPGWRAQWVESMEPGEPDAPLTGPAPGARTMDEDEILMLMDRQFAKVRAGDLVGAHEWYHEAVVVEWPQSGERIRGRQSLLALREAYPAAVGFEVDRMTARRNLGVGEYIIRYEGRPVHVVAIVEFADGKVVRETHYFAEPFEAPAWRSRWVERMGT